MVRSKLLLLSYLFERLDHITSFARSLDSNRATEITGLILGDQSIQKEPGITDLISYVELKMIHLQNDRAARFFLAKAGISGKS